MKVCRYRGPIHRYLIYHGWHVAKLARGIAYLEESSCH